MEMCGVFCGFVRSKFTTAEGGTRPQADRARASDTSRGSSHRLGETGSLLTMEWFSQECVIFNGVRSRRRHFIMATKCCGGNTSWAMGRLDEWHGTIFNTVEFAPPRCGF